MGNFYISVLKKKILRVFLEFGIKNIIINGYLVKEQFLYQMFFIVIKLYLSNCYFVIIKISVFNYM